MAVEFESVWFMQVFGASVVARPIRRPGRSNVASVVDDYPDDCVSVDARSRKVEGVFAHAARAFAEGLAPREGHHPPLASLG